MLSRALLSISHVCSLEHILKSIDVDLLVLVTMNEITVKQAMPMLFGSCQCMF